MMYRNSEYRSHQIDLGEAKEENQTTIQSYQIQTERRIKYKGCINKEKKDEITRIISINVNDLRPE